MLWALAAVALVFGLAYHQNFETLITDMAERSELLSWIPGHPDRRVDPVAVSREERV